MTSQYNNVIYIPTDINQMNYYNPYQTNPYHYIKYVPTNLPIAQPVMNLPVIYNNQNNNFSDFVDCEVTIDDSQNFKNVPTSYGNSGLGNSNSRMSNNPINYMRSKSPKVLRNNNLGLNKSGILYYQSNSQKANQNSVLNYSLESYEPIKSNTPLLNNVSNFKPVQYTNNNVNQFVANTPVKKRSFAFPNTLSASTVHKKYSQVSRNKINLKKNITAFQPQRTFNNYSPTQNYQSLPVNIIPIDLNNRTITNTNNNMVLNNAIQMNQKKNQSKLLNNNPYIRLSTGSSKKKRNSDSSNKDLFQNSLSPIMIDNSKEKFLNSNSSINNQSLSKVFKECSNTVLLSNSPSNSNFNANNIIRTSSTNKLDISDFNDPKVLAGKNPSLASDLNNNSQSIRKSITTMNNKMNNPFIKNSNTLKHQNTLINTKSNLITKSLKEQKPSEDFSQYMFDQINKIRNNPRSFIETFKKAKDRIKKDKKGNLYYSGKIKVALYKGNEAFDETISALEKMKPMKSLLYKKNLSIKISENKNDFKTGDYLRKKINELIKSGVKIRAFWRDIIHDPEVNFLLMIVDDNPIRRGGKRKDILNPEMKYIGINAGMIDQYFVCYTVLSDE